MCVPDGIITHLLLGVMRWTADTVPVTPSVRLDRLASGSGTMAVFCRGGGLLGRVRWETCEGRASSLAWFGGEDRVLGFSSGSSIARCEQGGRDRWVSSWMAQSSGDVCGGHSPSLQARLQRRSGMRGPAEVAYLPSASARWPSHVPSTGEIPLQPCRSGRFNLRVDPSFC